MSKEVVKIQLDYLQGAIWISDQETGEPMTGIEIVDNDDVIRTLNLEISNLFNSYYEFDSHGVPCWFNKEQERKDKEKMLSLLGKLNTRLAEINDGSYIVDDRETPRVQSL